MYILIHSETYDRYDLEKNKTLRKEFKLKKIE